MPTHLLDPYTDDNYHLVVSMGEDGSLQLNRSIEGLKGKLKVRVMASDFDTTLAAWSPYSLLLLYLLLCIHPVHNDKHMNLYLDLKNYMPKHLYIYYTSICRDILQRRATFTIYTALFIGVFVNGRSQRNLYHTVIRWHTLNIVSNKLGDRKYAN
jgi:hypothetical protein